MRIRTIKPQFWSHPLMSRASDAARLIAIGLLNVADDEGYFYASTAYVRSQLYPFDESSDKVRKAIEELVRLDFIEVRHSKDHGPIGFVKKFKVHQKIDRANSSTIKPYFAGSDSANDRRTIDEDSTINPCRKGMEGKGMESIAPTASTPVDPDAVETECLEGFLPAFDPEPEPDPEPTSKPAKRDEVYEALGDIEGGWQRLNDIAKGRVRKALKEINKSCKADGIKATRAEVDRRVAEYRRTMPRAPVTAMAIASNWARLGVNTQEQQMNIVSHPVDAPAYGGPGTLSIVKAIREQNAKPASERLTV